MKTMKQYPSYDQNQLKVICDKLCDRIEDLLDFFDIEYRSANSNMITMSCPIHDGDNKSALNIYHEGDSYRGNWKCRTHGCEKIFKESILGFIRGILSNKKHNWSQKQNKICSFKEAVEFAQSFLGDKIINLGESTRDNEKHMFTKIMQNFSNTSKSAEIDNDDEEAKPQLTKQVVRSSLKIPAEYYINRGYTFEILDKYDIGLCDKPNKEMSNRVVAPIYDQTGFYVVGCTGRSIFDKCDKCNYYHDHNDDCPAEEIAYRYCKWKHSSGFKAQNHLYNIWFAQEHIKKSHAAIIVESPGNVWRLAEAGFHNAVAIFGSSLSDRQKIMLDASGAMTIVVLTDNDDAGNKAAEQIKSKCQNTYKIIRPQLIKSDIGEMTVEEVKSLIVPILEKIS